MTNPLKDKNRTCLIFCDDARHVLQHFQGSIDLIVTSPPYADARKKHYDSTHPDNFSNWLSTFHKTFWNCLKEDGSLVINIKDKIVDGVRHRYAWRTIDALAQLGWKCIDDYIWHKPNPMPGYWPTRLRDGWEYCFHLAKIKRPYVNQDAVRIPIGDWAKTRLQKLGNGDLMRHNSENSSGFGRNLSRWVGRDTVLPTNVLTFSPVTKNKGHPAAFPVDLPTFFIKLLSRPGGLIVDPFAGSGTSGVAALSLQRDCVLIDNSKEYCQVAYTRVLKETEAKDYRVYFGNNIGNYSEQLTKTKPEQFVLELQQTHTPYGTSKPTVKLSK